MSLVAQLKPNPRRIAFICAGNAMPSSLMRLRGNITFGPGITAEHHFA
jgi:hypothetical protein